MFLKDLYEFHFGIFIYLQNSISFTIHISLYYRETHWTEAHLWSIYRISYEPPDGSQIARTLYQNLSMRQRSIFFANSKEYQRYLNNHEWIHIQNTHTQELFSFHKNCEFNFSRYLNLFKFWIPKKIGPNKSIQSSQYYCINELEIFLAFQNYFSFYFWSRSEERRVGKEC